MNKDREIKPFLKAKLGDIPDDWEYRKIGEFITDFRGGASLTPKDFVNCGVKVLPKIGVVRGGILSIDNEKQQYCSKEFADDNPISQVDKKYLIVVLRDLVPSGPCIGLTVKIPNNDVLVLAQGVYGIIIDETKLNSEYLIQLSNSSWYRKYVRRIMVGSTQVHIRNSEYQDMAIPYTLLPEQKRIAAILGCWDSAIEKTEKLIT
ncbi:restriction endonuclease subunit S, partial [Planctomycetota bacterium]